MEFQISGKVIKGDGYGKKLGFPTANLDRREYVRKKMKIRFGIWAGRAEIAKSVTSPKSPPKIGGEYKGWYKAGIVIGPLDKKGLPRIEAHLIGFKGNLYGKYLNIYLKTYLRPYRKFNTEKELKAQIAKDVGRIKKLK